MPRPRGTSSLVERAQAATRDTSLADLQTLRRMITKRCSNLRSYESPGPGLELLEEQGKRISSLIAQLAQLSHRANARDLQHTLREIRRLAGDRLECTQGMARGVATVANAVGVPGHEAADNETAD